MNDNVENLILEQLRAIREDLSSVKETVEGMILSMAGYMRDIDLRVEHLEEKFGGQS